MLSRVIPSGLIAFTELIADDEVHAGQIVGEPSLPSGAAFRLELVDEVDDIEEAAAGAATDAGSGNGDRQMRLAGPGR